LSFEFAAIFLIFFQSFEKYENSLKTPVLFFLFLAASTCFSQSANLPLDHWAYSFLPRLEAKGLISSYELRTRPLPRARIALLINQIESNAAKNPQWMTRSDWKLLEQLESDLGDELVSHPRNDKPISPEPHLIHWQEENAVVSFDLLGRQEIRSYRGRQYQPDVLLSETTLGGRLRGRLGNRIGFSALAGNTLTRGENRDPEDENFDPSQGSPVVTSGDNVYRDVAEAYFSWDNPWLRIEAGKDQASWGPFYNGGLAISANSPPADLIRVSLRLKRLKFTYLHSWLRSSLGAKYLAAHRLDVMVMENLFLGVGETVIYGDRALEPSYLNPFMLYHIAEHHLGDRDNNNLFIDLTLTRIRNLSLFAEWYIDDMTTTASWTNYFGNKFGWAIGGLWSDAIGLPNIDFHFSYRKISPYVYSHWDSLNIYTHYDRIIGNQLGPNADNITLEIGNQFGRDFRVLVSADYTRKGHGEANTETRPRTGTQKDFLKGTIQEQRRVGFRIIDQVYRDLYFSIAYWYVDTRNLSFISDNNSYDHQVRLQVDMNY